VVARQAQRSLNHDNHELKGASWLWTITITGTSTTPTISTSTLRQTARYPHKHPPMWHLPPGYPDLHHRHKHAIADETA
jgi:hypothetical protein